MGSAVFYYQDNLMKYVWCGIKSVVQMSQSEESSAWAPYVAAFVSFFPSWNHPLYLTWEKYVTVTTVRVTTSAYSQPPLSTQE